MFEIIKKVKVNDNYVVLDKTCGTKEIVPLDEIVKAVKLGIEITGVSISNNKLRIQTLYDKAIKQAVLDDGIVVLDENDSFVSSASKIAKSKYENLVVYNFSNIDMSKGLFSGCRTNHLDLSNFDASSVVNMYAMFSGCNVKSIDFGNFDTSHVKFMESMFERCAVSALDLSSFNTSKVINMKSMFSECNMNLNLSSFDTSNVTDMEGMFSFYRYNHLDLSSFDTSKVTNMNAMFAGCVIEYLDLTSFNISSLKGGYDIFNNAIFMNSIISHVKVRRSQEDIIKLVNNYSACSRCSLEYVD